MLHHVENMFFQNECIDFSATMNFLGIPEPVMQAARSGLVAAMRFLQENEGTLEEHVAEWEGVKPEHIFCSNGASEVVRNFLNAQKPQKALIPAPGFEEYIRALSMVQCEIEYYYTKEPEGYVVQADDFCSHITEDIDTVFLCNPGNPTAVLYDRDFLEKVLYQCEKVHAFLILDECLLGFVEEAGDLTLTSKDASKFLFLVKSFTNMFALPGIRLGYGICTNEEMIAKMNGTILQVVSKVAQCAGIACTKEREFVQRSAKQVEAERQWLLGEFQKLDGITDAKGAADFIFFKSRPGLHAFSVMQGIMLRDCSNLEGLSEGYYRVAVRNREDNQKLIEVLKLWHDQEAG